MKCAACGYQDEIQGNIEGFQQGSLGDFYVGKLTREHPKYSTMDEHATLVGCPACGHVFMTTRQYHNGETH